MMDHRDRHIRRYFDALDAGTYDSLRSVFDEDVVYQYPDFGEFVGVDAVLQFFDESRPTRNTKHTINRTIHTADVSVCEGSVEGETDDGPFEGFYCDVFEFNAIENRIEKIAVYSR